MDKSKNHKENNPEQYNAKTMKSGVHVGRIICFVLKGFCVKACVCVLAGRKQQERGWRSVSLQLGRRGKATVQKSPNHPGIPTMLSLHELLPPLIRDHATLAGKECLRTQKRGTFHARDLLLQQKNVNERQKGKERKELKGSVWNSVRAHRFTESTRAEKGRPVS